MSIFSLAYVSSASGLYEKNLYRDIAIKARAFNASRSITGMLLVHNETIIQFMEGPEVEVSDLYRRIEKDTRHKGPILVSTRHLDGREFPDWSMGYQESVVQSDPNFVFNLDQKTIRLHFPKLSSETSIALLNSYMRSSGLLPTSQTPYPMAV